MQVRARINLSKATRLIDDKTSLVADPNSGNPSSKKRRKSAFAEEDDGYQFVEEGFRLRFSDGETVDFYADDTTQKEAWMQALSQIIGKTSDKKAAKWTDMVVSRERSTRKAESKPAEDAKSVKSAKSAFSGPDIRVQAPSRDSSMNSTFTKSAPNSPMKSSSGSVLRKQLPVADGPEVPPRDDEDDAPATNKMRPGTPPLEPRTGHRSRKDVKSMIF